MVSQIPPPRPTISQPKFAAQPTGQTIPNETGISLNFFTPVISNGSSTTPSSANSSLSSTPVSGNFGTPTSTPSGSPSLSALPYPYNTQNDLDTFEKKKSEFDIPNPNLSPAQRLQDKYARALMARNEAEQKRTEYLNEASQDENQALAAASQQQQATQPQPQAAPSGNPFSPTATQSSFQPTAQAPAALNQAAPDPTQQFQQQLQSLQQQPAQAPPQQPQQPGYDPAAQQQALQQQIMQQQAQPQAQQTDPYAQQQQALQQQMLQQQALQQQMQQQAQPQVQQMDPYAQQQQMMQQAQQQQQQQPQQAPLNEAELNNKLEQSKDPREKLEALNEIATRQVGNRQTFELLRREVANPMQVTPEITNQIQQNALVALLNLNNRPDYLNAPVDKLYGMDEMKAIGTSAKTDPGVKAMTAAVLGNLKNAGHPDPNNLIGSLLNDISKDKNLEVQNAVMEAQRGQFTPMAQPQDAPIMPNAAPAA
jgi:hypothetical protein